MLIWWNSQFLTNKKFAIIFPQQMDKISLFYANKLTKLMFFSIANQLNFRFSCTSQEHLRFFHTRSMKCAIFARLIHQSSYFFFFSKSDNQNLWFFKHNRQNLQSFCGGSMNFWLFIVWSVKFTILNYDKICIFFM